jgi:hypothetical protein
MTQQQQNPEPPPPWQAPPQAPPQGAPPPQQWQSPPQQPPSGWGQAGYVEGPSRPIGVTGTAIFFIIVGLITALAGVVSLAGGSLLGTVEDTSGLGAAFAGFFAVLGVVITVIAILFLASGVGLLLGKAWARVIGLILAVLGVLLNGLAVLGAVQTLDQPGGPGGLVFAGVLLVLFILAVLALATAGRYFAYRR